jgi:hypothetical protein
MRDSSPNPAGAERTANWRDDARAASVGGREVSVPAPRQEESV